MTTELVPEVSLALLIALNVWLESRSVNLAAAAFGACAFLHVLARAMLAP